MVAVFGLEIDWMNHLSCQRFSSSLDSLVSHFLASQRTTDAPFNVFDVHFVTLQRRFSCILYLQEYMLNLFGFNYSTVAPDKAKSSHQEPTPPLLRAESWLIFNDYDPAVCTPRSEYPIWIIRIERFILRRHQEKAYNMCVIIKTRTRCLPASMIDSVEPTTWCKLCVFVLDPENLVWKTFVFKSQVETECALLFVGRIQMDAICDDASYVWRMIGSINLLEEFLWSRRLPFRLRDKRTKSRTHTRGQVADAPLSRCDCTNTTRGTTPESSSNWWSL